jgi:hypothetical protein
VSPVKNGAGKSKELSKKYSCDFRLFISIENVKEELSDEFLEKPKKRKDSLFHHALCYNFELMHIGY